MQLSVYNLVIKILTAVIDNLVIKILTAVIVLVDLYKCIIKEYYGRNTHLLFE